MGLKAGLDLTVIYNRLRLSGHTAFQAEVAAECDNCDWNFTLECNHVQITSLNLYLFQPLEYGLTEDTVQQKSLNTENSKSITKEVIRNPELRT